MSPLDDGDGDVVDRVITKALGEEIRRAREALGLSQSQLVALMPSGLHAKTLASYEQGVRQCTVVRLGEIARALGTSSTDLLARALVKAEIDMQTIQVLVDLDALLNDSRSEVRYLHRWARTRRARYPADGLARLDGAALKEMAVIFGVELPDLISQLAMFAPDPAVGRSPDRPVPSVGH